MLLRPMSETDNDGQTEATDDSAVIMPECSNRTTKHIRGNGQWAASPCVLQTRCLTRLTESRVDDQV